MPINGCAPKHHLLDIHAGGKVYKACIPYVIMDTIMGTVLTYVWPLEIKVAGGVLINASTSGGSNYSFYPTAGNGNGDTGNGDKKTGCDNKNITASGRNFIVCIPYSITSLGKLYIWPLEIKVLGGTLKRFSIGTGFGYTFIPIPGNGGKETGGIINGGDIIKGKKTNGAIPSEDQIIPGIDNTVLIIAGLGLFLFLQD